MFTRIVSKFSRKSSESFENNNDVTIARESLHEIRRVSNASDFEYHIDSRRAFRLSYLRDQFASYDLKELYDKYIYRIHQAYFSLFLILQILLNVTHFFVVLFINLNENTTEDVVLDLTIYGTIGITALIVLYFNEKHGNERREIFAKLSFATILLIFILDIMIPIYYFYQYTCIDNFRPANASCVILACYVFNHIRKNYMACLSGIIISISYLFVFGFITYANESYVLKKLLCEIIYMICINGIGIYIRYINEIITRKSFLDHRASVESTLKVEFEKLQEEQLMTTIIPEYAIKEVRNDILKNIKVMESLMLPEIDPMRIPYVRKHDNVSILYADIVNYTSMTSQLPVDILLKTLNDLFSGFDEASEKLNVLRIKFLGDCYYCVAGLPPNPAPNHAEACVDLGLKMIEIIQDVRSKRNLLIDMRIGIHSGSILSGIIGSTKWQFDIWSKDVILANIMESTGEPGKVHITQHTHDMLTKSYNMVITNKGKTEKKLQPYNITTYLIAPECTEEKNLLKSDRLNNDRIKRLSVIGEILNVEQLQHSKETLTNTSSNFIELKENAEPKNNSVEFILNHVAKNNENNNNVQLIPLYERRESLRKGSPMAMLINRRPSARPSRRHTPRRTAFMDIPLNRYRECISETEKAMQSAVETLPLTKYQQWTAVKDINPILLIFKNWKTEYDFIKMPDPFFKTYMILFSILFLASIIIQNITFSEWKQIMVLKYGTFLFVTLILTPVVWLYYLWNKYFAFDNINENLKPNNFLLNLLYSLSQRITENVLIRIIIYFSVCSLFTAINLIELFWCEIEKREESQNYLFVQSLFLYKTSEDPATDCNIPWHTNYTFNLGIIACFSFLHIHILLKLLFATGTTIVYSIIMWNFTSLSYKNSDTFNYQMEPYIAQILNLVFLSVTLYLINRQNDYLNKLDYKWNKTLITEQTEVNTKHRITKMLLKNILPLHVARKYLDKNRETGMQLYTEEHSDVAVIFASIIDFPTGSSEEHSLALMNRIIQDFDYLLLTEERSTPIEKIKVNNLTYMAACGLRPDANDSQNPEYSSEHVVITLVKFAISMIKTLECFNGTILKCKLRIGISNGKIMAGVVGSRKPLYDIWGDTVNLASRMDSTGVPGKIQITENTAQVLQRNGIKCEFRDNIYVKGKNIIPTYFVSLDQNNNLQSTEINHSLL